MLYYRLGVLVLSTILAAVIVVMATRHKDGFQMGSSSGSYVLPPPASKDVTQANFWSIVSIQQSTGRTNTFSTANAASTNTSNILKLISLVSTPSSSDKLQLTFSNYISIYALAKYNYDAVAARYALLNNFDTLQDELVANVSDQAAKTSFSRDPKQNSCNQLNSIAMSLYAKTQGLNGQMVDLSGTEITAEKLHAENRALQKSVGSNCGSSAACIKLASQDETVFPLLHEYDAVNESIVDNGTKVQNALSTVLQAYKAIECSLPTNNSIPTIDTVFSDSYINNLGFIDTQQLSEKLAELSSYYVSPETIKYISKQLIATNEYKTKLQTTEDYVFDMSKTMNNIVSMTTNLAEGSMFYDEKGMAGYRTCPAGFVCSQTKAIPTICPAGYYCPSGTIDTPVPCPAKTYSPPGSFAVTSCTERIPTGYFLQTVEEFTSKIEGFSTTILAPCPAGTYCPENSVSAIPCPIGTYNPNTSAKECIKAPAGCYVDTTGSKKYTACNKGTYNPSTGATTSSACIPCPASTYCPSDGMTMYNTCFLGTFSGTRGAISSSVCTPCAPGTYGFGLITNQSQCLPCPTGSYCNGGTVIECPAGTYCPPRAAGPTPCPAGLYGSDAGLSTAACNGLCQAGYYCNAGSTTSTQQVCEAGYFCPTGTYSTCPTGTASCPTGAGTQLPQLCPAGTYCPKGSSIATKCPGGTYNNTSGATSSSACISCPVGYYCPEGSLQPISCLAGTYSIYQNAITKNTCQYCRAGTYSNNAASSCVLCEEGHYCPGPLEGNEGVVDERYIRGQGGRVICPTGTYNLIAGEREILACLTCPPGFYCPDTKTKTPCPSGTFSSATGVTNLSACLPCSENTFSNAGATFCSLCPPGSYCPDIRTKFDCPQNTYSTTNGAKSPSTCLTCPTGTYSASASASCTYCLPGTYGNSYSGSGSGSNLNSRCITCSPGSFCPGVPNNIYIGTNQLTGINGINVCPAGTFSTAGSSSCEYCPPGKSSRAGSTSCLTCNAGEYCPGPPANASRYNGSTSPVSQGDGGKFDCPPGSYCPPGNINPIKCSIGEFCPIRSGSTVSCPPAFVPGQPCCPIGTYYDYTPSFVPQYFLAESFTFAAGNMYSIPVGTYNCVYTQAPTSSEYSFPTLVNRCPSGESFLSTSYCSTISYTSNTNKSPPANFIYFSGFNNWLPDYGRPRYGCINWTPNPALFNYTSSGSGSGSTYTINTRTDNFKCSVCPKGTYGYNYTLSTGGSSPKIADLFKANSIAQGINPPTVYAYGMYGDSSKSMNISPNALLINENSPIAQWGYYVTRSTYGTVFSTRDIFNQSSSFPFYYEGDIVSYQGAHYMCIQPAINNEPPTNTTKWLNLNLASVCLSCPGGTYNNTTGLINQSGCLQCPAGTYSNSTAAGCSYCPPGTWSTPGSTSCQSASLINPGYYYSGVVPTTLYTGGPNLAEIKQCPGGTFSTGSAAGCTYCSPGYESAPGSTSCSICDVGEYCPGPPTGAGSSLYTGIGSLSIQGSRGDLDCPAGSYCQFGTSTPTPCPAGTYNPNTKSTTLSACLPCSAGQYSQAGSPSCSTCPAGRYCTTPATSVICPIGSYCPSGTVTPIKCNAGQYNPQQGKSTDTACLYCSAQTFSTNSGSATCSPCALGTYSGTGATTCISCPAGSFCTTCKNEADYCTLSDNIGFVTSAANPKMCPAGTYSLAGQQYCTDCPTGRYCPSPGTPVPQICPAGTYSAAKAIGCIYCAAGTYSAAGQTSCTICETGTYCPGPPVQAGSALYTGSTSPLTEGSGGKLICPPGKYSTAGLAACLLCPVGQYCPIERCSDTVGCNPGYIFTPTYATVPYTGQQIQTGGSCVACTASQINAGSCNNSGRAQCPPGTFSNSGSTGCSYCPSGTTTTSWNSSTCTPCPAGLYCPGVTDSGTVGTGQSLPSSTIYLYRGVSSLNPPKYVCPAGSYCPIGSIIATPCEQGYYTTTSGQSICTACNGGQYNISPGLTSCLTCSEGKYSAPGSKSCTNCDPGTYSSSGSTVCTGCPSGKYSTAVGANSISTCSTCPAGTVSVLNSGSTYCVYCPPGKYSSVGEGPSGCRTCNQGQYCPGPPPNSGSVYDANTYAVNPQGVGGQIICPAGYSCTSGMSQPTICPAGKFSPSGAISCTNCATGYFSSTPGASTCSLCPGGTVSKLLSGSDHCTYCPPGTYSSPTSILTCIPCTAGNYCPGIPADSGNSIYVGSTSILPPGINGQVRCPLGTYCPTPGTITPTKCPAGYKGIGSGAATTQAAACEACQGGTYSNSLGATNSDTCLLCPAGTYSTAGSTVCTYCSSGTGNSSPGSSSCTNCRGGQYCPGPPSSGTTYSGGVGSSPPPPTSTFGSGSLLAGQKYTCSPGTYSRDGATICIACPPGTYQQYADQASCTSCVAGKYNPVYGSFSPDACINAPAGNYATVAPGTLPYAPYATAGPTMYTPCSPGYYQSESGKNGCLSCGTGTFSLGGQVSCTICLAGTYQNAERSINCIYCPPNQYSNAGASSCSPCLAGQYCPGPPSGAGSYYDGSSMNTSAEGSGGQVVCPPGTYCPGGGSAPLQCPIGTYCPISGLSAGSACPPGQECDTPGEITPNQVCPAGYYCPLGTGSSPIACVAGTYNSLTGQTSIAACIACAPGTASIAGATVCNIPVAQPGYYIPNGSTTFMPCPAGTYLDVSDGKLVTDCKSCPAGTFSTATAAKSISTCSPCTAGSYCPGRTGTPPICAAGTYSLAQASYCTICRDGSYCPATSKSETPCAAGSYCPTPSTQTACAAGTYNNSTGATSCMPCPVGYTCPSTGMNAPTKCQPGFTCADTNNTIYITTSTNIYTTVSAAAAAPGTTTTTLALTSNQACPAGYYCPDGTNPIKCPAGSWCPAGASSPTQCAANTYSAATGASTNVCTACATNSFSIPGSTSCTTSCITGAYCSAYYVKSTLSTIYNPTVAQPSTRYTIQNPSILSMYPDNTSALFMGETLLEAQNKCTNDTACIGYLRPNGIPGFTYYTTSSSTVLTTPFPSGGYVWDRGTKYPMPVACAAGTYNSSPSSLSCTNCSAGSYCPTGSATNTPCPLGSYCSTPSTIAPCPGGTYGATTGLTAATQCTTCPVGSYCTNGKQYTCTGGYTTGTGTSTPAGCFYCPVGTYTSATNNSCTYCPAGTTSLPASTSLTSCTTCPTGKYCPGPPSTGNTYIGSGSSAEFIPTIAAQYCPPGTYCPSGGSSPLQCPIGAYCPIQNMGSGSSCPPGQLCNTLGEISPADSCPPGTYSPGGAGSSCTPCPAGSYCLNRGASTTTGACPVGTYSLAGATGCTYCPPGTNTSITGATSPTACTSAAAAAGYFYPGINYSGSGPGSGSSGSTPILYYGVSSPALPKISCPIGSFCPLGSSQPTPCGPGTYNAGINATTCSACTAGTYSLTLGAISSATCQQCPAGSYCTTPATIATCPVGFYCPAGTQNPIGCAIGTYSSGSGASAVSTCTPCTPGTTSNVGADSCMNISSPPGFYWPPSSQSIIPCPAGTYLSNSYGGQTITDCLQCTAGSYCPRPASVTPTPCASGTYSNSIGAITCKICPVGFNCTTAGGTTTPTKCNPGFSCTGGTNTTYIPTTTNVYSTSASAFAATGTTTSTLAMTNNQACPAGYYCPDGTYPIQCPAGSWCPAGASVPTPCPVNTYGPNAGASTPPNPNYDLTSTCRMCNLFTSTTFAQFSASGASYCSSSAPAGTYAPVTGTPQAYTYFGARVGSVSAGVVYTINGTVPPWTIVTTNFINTSTVYRQSGYYIIPSLDVYITELCSSVGVEQCSAYNIDTTNNAYSFISSSQLATAVNTITPNTNWLSRYTIAVNPYGSIYATTTTLISGRSYTIPIFYLNAPIVCPAGTYNSNTSSTTLSACTTCSAGSYCPTGSAINTPCPLGSYCSIPSTIAPCPDGTYGATTGLTSASQCTTCPVGSYCFNGTNITCNGGYTIGTGKSSPASCVPCPTGTYSSPTNTTCLYCPPGQTSTPGSTLCVPCPPGQYCSPPANSGSLYVGSNSGNYLSTLAPVPCPPGTFCPGSGSSPQQCLIGQYCPIGGLTTGSPCPPGKRCDTLGEISPTGGSCPPGTFSPGGAGSSCTPCPAGKYSATTGATASTTCLVCPIGTYSTGVAISCTPCPTGKTTTATGATSLAACI